MEFLDHATKALNFLNNIAFWDIVTAISALSISIILFNYRRRIPGFSVHITYYMGTGHDLYPNTLNFEIRNLMDSPLVVSRPNFNFTKHLASGHAAHGNSATGDYEIKFRGINPDGSIVSGHSYTSIMLRHRDNAFAYIPFDDDLTKEEFEQKLHANSWWDTLLKKDVLGYLKLHVVLLKEQKPVLVSMSIPVKNIKKHPQVPPLGSNSHPKQAT